MRFPKSTLLPLITPFLGAQALWVPVDPPAFGPGTVAFDSARQRTVILGSLGDVWELDGAATLHRAVDASVQGPVPRTGTSMVFDEARGHVLVFGGQGLSSALGDTWAWDGFAWSQSFSVVPPPRRTNGLMVWDSVRQRVVLHGGQDRLTALLDTWEHDGVQWTLRNPVTVPPPLLNGAMAFDRTLGLTLYAGNDRFDNLLVWAWDGTDWSLRSAPGLRHKVGAWVHDPVRRRTVLIGGDSTGQPGTDDILEYDGTSWLTVGTAPPLRRRLPAGWFDPVRGAVVVAGGVSGSFAQHSDRWSWDGSALVQIATDVRPTSIVDHAWLRDPSARATIAFTDPAGLGIFETWSWNGASWQFLAIPQPSARTSSATATDHATGRGYLFGGLGLSALPLGELWSIAGGTWTLVAPSTATSPSPRHQASLIVDEARGIVVLFGGYAASGAVGDTWEWNRTAWTRRTTAVAPSARAGAAMTWDSVRGRAVLFGGVDAGLQVMNDTWGWDGVQWRAIATATRPTAGNDVSMAFDRARGRLVLTVFQALFGPGGGRDGTLETWEHDGIDWRQRGAVTALLPLRIAYDEQRRRVTGWDGDRVYDWTETPAEMSSYGAACGMRPPFSVRATPRTGNAEFGLSCRTGAGGVAVFALSASAGSTPIGGGCAVLLGPVLASTIAFPGANGIAEQIVPLPPSPALAGLVLFAQAGRLAPGQPLSVSTGLRIAVGD